jgi:hypothetical protein
MVGSAEIRSAMLPRRSMIFEGTRTTARFTWTTAHDSHGHGSINPEKNTIKLFNN